MKARLYSKPENTFKWVNLPTLTEINRIRHTIEVLKRNEDYLLKRMNIGREESAYILLKDVNQLAMEICWGWEDLKRMVGKLSDDFLEKHNWLDESIQGIDRCMTYHEVTNRLFSYQRYSFV